MEEKKHGGVRPNSGRKKLSFGSRKQTVIMYFETDIVLGFGSQEKLKASLYEYAKKVVKKDNSLDSEINFTPPTESAYDGKKMDKVTHDEPLQYFELKSNISPTTGLPYKSISLYDSFVDKINSARSSDELNAIMLKVKSEAMLPKEKLQLDHIAMEYSKENLF